MDYSTFKEQLSESPLLGSMAGLIAIGLPLAEFFVVILLIVPNWRLKGFYAALTLMTVFTVYVIALLSFSNKLPCSCGGIISELSWPQHLVFNGLFILLACLGLILEKRRKQSDRILWNTLSAYNRTGIEKSL